MDDEDKRALEQLRLRLNVLTEYYREMNNNNSRVLLAAQRMERDLKRLKRIWGLFKIRIASGQTPLVLKIIAWVMTALIGGATLLGFIVKFFHLFVG